MLADGSKEAFSRTAAQGGQDHSSSVHVPGEERQWGPTGGALITSFPPAPPTGAPSWVGSRCVRMGVVGREGKTWARMWGDVHINTGVRVCACWGHVYMGGNPGTRGG